MSLTPAFLDELRARTLLSTVVGRTVKLTRAGREWKACCPFHNEKTPSFTINDEKGFYHCFGCGAHGDAIRFLTEAAGLGFMDAVKELADACGLTVPAPDPRAREKAERAEGLHDVTAAAAGWFGEQLDGRDGGEARAYLDRRGVSPAMRQAFGLGFAPDSRGRLKTALNRFGGDKLLETGLLVKPDDDREPYDRFRGRLMIPIHDQRGRVIAFGGRVIGAGEPKYLNSPDTPLFDKGRTLYNLDRAGPAARKTGRIIVVEGYMDVIALAQAGFDEVVAPLGTALTETQIERLWRLTDVPILCFDGDAAGQRAAMRAAMRALPMLAPSRSLAFAHPAGRRRSRRSGARRWRAAGLCRAARRRRAAGRAAVARRAGRPAPDHPGSARWTAPAADGPCRGDRRSLGRRRVSPGVPRLSRCAARRRAPGRPLSQPAFSPTGRCRAPGLAPRRSAAAAHAAPRVVRSSPDCSPIPIWWPIMPRRSPGWRWAGRNGMRCAMCSSTTPFPARCLMLTTSIPYCGMQAWPGRRTRCVDRTVLPFRSPVAMPSLNVRDAIWRL